MQTINLTPERNRKAPHISPYLYPAKNFCSLETVKTSPGDRTQVAALRCEWIYWQQVKEEFLSAITYPNLKPAQRAQAEITLAMITGTIKAIDNQVNHFLFGMPLQPEQPAYPIEYYIRKQLHYLKLETRKEVFSKQVHIAYLVDKNIQIMRYNSELVRQLKRNGIKPYRMSKTTATESINA